MYSDDESEVSSHSSGSLQRRALKARAAAEAAEKPAQDFGDEYGYDDEAPEVMSSDSGSMPDCGGLRGPVPESSVPAVCMERCVVFIDCSLFDPTRLQGDPNEHVVECCMRVVHYPFEAPRVASTQTLLYTPKASASNMTKVARAQTAQRWQQQMTVRHGVPCVPRGTVTGFEDLRNTVRTLRVHVNEYLHLLAEQRALRRRGEIPALSPDTDTRVSMHLTEAEMLPDLAALLRGVVEAATETCDAEVMPHQVAFLTTEKQRDEVCRALLWMQKSAGVALPPHQVFTVTSALGEDWERLVAEEMPHFNCGYHRLLMTNKYGNPPHCCEGTVRAMAHVVDAAVRSLHGG